VFRMQSSMQKSMQKVNCEKAGVRRAAFLFLSFLSFVSFTLFVSSVCQAQRRVRAFTFSQDAPRFPAKSLEQVLLMPYHLPLNDSAFMADFDVTEGEILPWQQQARMVENLLRTGLFSDVRCLFDTLSKDLDVRDVDVHVRLQERIHAAPVVILSSGGGVSSIGAGWSMANAFETATGLDASLRYRSANAIGWEAALELTQNRMVISPEPAEPSKRAKSSDVLQFSDLYASFRAVWNRYRNEQELRLEHPLWRGEGWFSGGVHGYRASGEDFIYARGDSGLVMSLQNGLEAARYVRRSPFSEGMLRAWCSAFATYWETEFSLLGIVEANLARRESEAYSRFWDNSIHVFLGATTLGYASMPARVPEQWNVEMQTMPPAQRPRYTPGYAGLVGVGILHFFNKPNVGAITYGIVSGQGSVGLLADAAYVYASIKGTWGSFRVQDGSPISNNVPLADIGLKANLFFTPQLTFAMNLRGLQGSGSPSGSVGGGFGQMVVGGGENHLNRFGGNGFGNGFDNYAGSSFESGVRGYPAFVLVGSGGGVANVELRGIPLGEVGRTRLTGTLFLDAGWITYDMPSIYWLGSRGVAGFGGGVRLHYPAITGGLGLLRLDIAYNAQLRQFAQVVLSTQEAFSLFGEVFRHQVPDLLGSRQTVE
jgi:hypothetical protein